MKMLCALLFAGLMPAQTGIAPDQIRSTGETPTHVWIGTKTGVIQAKLGPGLVVVTDPNGEKTLSAVAAPTSFVITVSYLLLQPTAQGTYVTSAGMILRNGVPQVEGLTFKRENGAVVPLSSWGSDPVHGVVFRGGPG